MAPLKLIYLSKKLGNYIYKENTQIKPYLNLQIKNRTTDPDLIIPTSSIIRLLTIATSQTRLGVISTKYHSAQILHWCLIWLSPAFDLLRISTNSLSSLLDHIGKGFEVATAAGVVTVVPGWPCAGGFWGRRNDICTDLLC